MFKRQVKSLNEILQKLLRDEGFETPLKERRLIDSWDSVVGSVVARYTGDKFIRNQILYVKITNPALRQDLSMMRSQLIKRLNGEVGAMVIADIRIY